MKTRLGCLVAFAAILLSACSFQDAETAFVGGGLAVQGGGYLSHPVLDECSIAVIRGEDGRNILYYCAVRSGTSAVYRTTQATGDLYGTPVILSNELLTGAVSVTALGLSGAEIAAVGTEKNEILLYRPGPGAVKLSFSGTNLAGQPLALLPPAATLGSVTLEPAEIGLAWIPQGTREIRLSRIPLSALSGGAGTLETAAATLLATLSTDIAPGGSYVRWTFLGHRGGLLLYARRSSRGDYDIHAGNGAGFEVVLPRLNSLKDDLSPCLLPVDQSLFMASKAFAPSLATVSFNLFRWDLAGIGIDPVVLSSSSAASSSEGASSSSGSSSSSGPQFYTLTYNANCADYNGTAPTDTNQYAVGQMVTVTADNTGELSRDTYMQIGWYDAVDKKLYQPRDGSLNATFAMPARNVTLDAKWVRIHVAGTGSAQLFYNDAAQDYTCEHGWNALYLAGGTRYLAGTAGSTECSLVYRKEDIDATSTSAMTSIIPSGMQVWGSTLKIAVVKHDYDTSTRTVGYYSIPAADTPNSDTSFSVSYYTTLLSSNSFTGLTNTGIFADDSGTIVAGVNATNTACYWDQSGTMYPLPGGEGGIAKAIVRDGGDIYVCGNAANGGCIWKNGAVLNFFPGTSINALTVVNGTVHAVGQSGSSPAYWVGGATYLLFGGAAATTICIKNGIVYIGGYQSIEGTPIGGYWINGGQFNVLTGLLVPTGLFIEE